MADKPTIAIAASRGIGDGLITLVLANNLVRNGFDVTLFCNSLAQLNDWFPSVTILPYPACEKLAETLNHFDLTFSDAVSPLTKNKTDTEKAELAKQYLFFCMTKFTEALKGDPSEFLKHHVKDENKLKILLPLTNGAGYEIGKLDPDAPLTDRVMIYCRDILKLQNATKENGITKPQDSCFREYPSRIIIHATSTRESKNWARDKFIALANKLNDAGWETVFAFAPFELPSWQAVLKENKLDYVAFESLSDAARYIDASGYFIGTDSGLGHLASNLGIPTCTICRTGNKFFRWRPGWAPGLVIKTKYKLKFFGKMHWHWLISVDHVFHEWDAFISSLEHKKS